MFSSNNYIFASQNSEFTLCFSPFDKLSDLENQTQQSIITADYSFLLVEWNKCSKINKAKEKLPSKK